MTRTSKQVRERLNAHGSYLGNFGEDCMQCPGFQRVVERDRNHVHGRPLMAQPDVAALLSNNGITETLQYKSQTIATLVVVSYRLNGNQLVCDVVHCTNRGRTGSSSKCRSTASGTLLRSSSHVSPSVICVTQRSRAKTAFLGVADLEDHRATLVQVSCRCGS